MSLNNLFTKINNQFHSQNSLFSVDIDRQKKFIADLQEPKDSFERSYLQFKCQKYLENSLKILLKEFISSLIIFPFLLFLCLKQKRKRTSASNSGIAVTFFSGVDFIIPDDLTGLYEQIITIPLGKEYFLTGRDFIFIAPLLRRYFFSPYFVFKNCYKIALYRAAIFEYSPVSIICSSEYSFTSSILTEFCERNKIENINVMHGEKLFNIRDSFFKFHRCYVWDEHYCRLFKSLRADPAQFVINEPASLRISSLDETTPLVYELTYYLSTESEKELQNIKRALLSTQLNPSTISIRIHPRYSDRKKVNEIFHHFTIEDPDSCNIIRSFSQTKRIVSLYSTVLFQGYKMGKEVFIDDISQNNKYQILKKLNYLMLTKPHKKLSEFSLNS